METKNWSATSDDFRMANEFLLEKYDNVYALMKKVGNNGDIDKTDYREWPIFSKIRKEKKFQDTDKEIFDEEYAILETPKRPVQELVEKELREKQRVEDSKDCEKREI